MTKNISKKRQQREYSNLSSRSDISLIKSDIRSGVDLKTVANRYGLKYYQVRLISPVVKSKKTAPVRKKQRGKASKPKPQPKPQPKQPKAKATKPKPKKTKAAARKRTVKAKKPKAKPPKPQQPQPKPKPKKKKKKPTRVDKSIRTVKLKDGRKVKLYTFQYEYDPPVDVVNEGLGRIMRPIIYDISRIGCNFNNPIKFSFSVLTDKGLFSKGVRFMNLANRKQLWMEIYAELAASLLSKDSKLLVYSLELIVTELL